MSEADPILLYRQIKASWQKTYKIWYSVHYSLGAITIVLSTLVAAKPLASDLPRNIYDVFAWLLALTTGFLAFFSAEERGNRYQRAWLLLTTIISKYDADSHTIPEDVIAVHELGEKIIHNVSGSRDATPTRSPPPPQN